MKANAFRPAMFLLVVLAGLFLLGSQTGLYAQAKSHGWRVWIRTDPCPGRFDWLSVAKDPSGGGGKNTYVPYETLIGNQGCTQSGPQGCTFEEATALMESLRSHDKFLDLCCHDYSVWENSTTGKRSIVLGKQGTAGFGWQIVKGGLCCEQAEELAGIPGSCGGVKGGGKATGAAGTFNGHWSVATDYGEMTVNLTQTGTHVTGTFAAPYGTGTLDGTITAGTLAFKWRSGEYTGSGEATLANDGRTFTGSWNDNLTKSQFRMTGTKAR